VEESMFIALLFVETMMEANDQAIAKGGLRYFGFVGRRISGVPGGCLTRSPGASGSGLFLRAYTLLEV
jgi:hypothetical protein